MEEMRREGKRLFKVKGLQAFEIQFSDLLKTNKKTQIVHVLHKTHSAHEKQTCWVFLH